MAQEKKGLSADGMKKGFRKAVLAGMGAAALAKERVADATRTMIAKGEKVEPDVKRAFKKLVERRRKTGQKVGVQMGTQVKRLVRSLPVVTRGDIAALAQRVDGLAKKIDGLNRKPKATKAEAASASGSQA